MDGMNRAEGQETNSLPVPPSEYRGKRWDIGRERTGR